MNLAVDMGQIDGACVQGLGFFMLEEYPTNEDGLVTANGTWTYKIPTIDNMPKEFNVDSTLENTNIVFSPLKHPESPLVHCATRAAVKAARKQLKSLGAVEGTDPMFRVDVPANMAVKQL